MSGKKDALTDVVQALQEHDSPASDKPTSSPSNLGTNQVVGRGGNIVNLGFQAQKKQ